MSKKFRISKPSMTKIYSSGEASSFWSRGFDTNFRIERPGGLYTVDHTKLAAAQRAIANFVNIVTGKQIPVVFQTREESYTDGKTVVIGSKLEDDNFDPAVGLALHEGSHILLTNFDILKNADRLGSQFHQFVQFQGCDPKLEMTTEDLNLIFNLFNYIEDRRIDYHIYKNAPGYRMYYEAMYDKYFNSSVVDKALQSENTKCDESIDSYLFRIINLTNKHRNLDALVGLRKIWDIIDLANIQRLRSSEESLKVACSIYKVIQENIAQAIAQAKQKTTTKDECNCTGDNKEDSDNTKEKTQVKSDLSKGEMKRLEKAIQKQNEFVRGEQKKVGKLSKKDNSLVKTLKNAGSESVTVETYSGGQGGTAPVDTIVIKKMTPDVITSVPELFDTYTNKDIIENQLDVLNITDHWDEYRYTRQRKMQLAVNDGILLGKQLGKKLHTRNENKTLKSTRLKSGKIDRRLIAQLGFNNASVFQKIISDVYKNFFIHISIDASGSMNGRRFHNAIKSAVAIAQAASMTTGIRVQISFRGTACLQNKEKAVTLYAYDSEHDKMMKIKTYFKFIKVFGMTPEGIAFESIFNTIKQDAKSDECIFINYSDGAPSKLSGTCSHYSGIRFTKKVINKMREIGINVIGYFIDGKTGTWEHQQFKCMYGPDSEFIDTTNMTNVSKSINKKFLEIADQN